MTKFLPRVKLYQHHQRDRDILDWLDKIPPGFKSHAIKEAIWSSISKQQPQTAAVSVPDQARKVESKRINTTSTMRASLTFDTHELLADIRQIVEVGVTSALGHLTTNPSENLFDKNENEQEIEAMLDDLDMSFMLDDDEEEEL